MAKITNAQVDRNTQYLSVIRFAKFITFFLGSYEIYAWWKMAGDSLITQFFFIMIAFIFVFSRNYFGIICYHAKASGELQDLQFAKLLLGISIFVTCYLIYAPLIAHFMNLETKAKNETAIAKAAQAKLDVANAKVKSLLDASTISENDADAASMKRQDLLNERKSLSEANDAALKAHHAAIDAKIDTFFRTFAIGDFTNDQIMDKNGDVKVAPDGKRYKSIATQNKEELLDLKKQRREFKLPNDLTQIDKQLKEVQTAVAFSEQLNNARNNVAHAEKELAAALDATLSTNAVPKENMMVAFTLASNFFSTVLGFELKPVVFMNLILLPIVFIVVASPTFLIAYAAKLKDPIPRGSVPVTDKESSFIETAKKWWAQWFNKPASIPANDASIIKNEASKDVPIASNEVKTNAVSPQKREQNQPLVQNDVLPLTALFQERQEKRQSQGIGFLAPISSVRQGAERVDSVEEIKKRQVARQISAEQMKFYKEFNLLLQSGLNASQAFFKLKGVKDTSQSSKAAKMLSRLKSEGLLQ